MNYDITALALVRLEGLMPLTEIGKGLYYYNVAGFPTKGPSRTGMIPIDGLYER